MQQAQLDLLVLAMQAGDKRAFSLLYRHYHRDLRRFAAYLLHNPAAAEDLVHNVWLKVSRRIGRLQDPQLFTSWLYRAVRWEVLDYQKQAAQRKHQSIDDSDGFTEPEPDDSGSSDLTRAMTLLKDDERLVLQLHYLHELELVQIALILDIPIGTVKSRLHRARKQLQQQLQTIN